MRLIDADKLDMSVKVDGDRTLSPISQLIAQTIIENAQIIESDEDCISRKAVIDAIYANGVWENEYNLTSSRIKKAVESLPPVTPKPKTDVLDKIRAEIEESVLESLSDGGDDWFAAEKVNECLEIIDKYKAESED